MTRVRGWLARRPVGRASVRRARVRAAAVLVVTAAAAVVLAVVSHQAWPPVVLGILCTDAQPALHLIKCGQPSLLKRGVPQLAEDLPRHRPVVAHLTGRVRQGALLRPRRRCLA